MTQYIDKSALVAEIKRRMKVHMESNHGFSARYDELKDILSFLDTLEVKDEVVSTDPIKAMKEALRTEYEKGRADAFKRAAESFCKATCNGNPPRSTCASLGTCKEYSNFIKFMKE